jgi:nitrate reductase gamma subunit
MLSAEDTDPRIRRTRSFKDIAILALLGVQLTLVMATITISAQHLDGSEMVRFMEWAVRYITFQLSVSSLMLDALFKVHSSA